MQLLQHTCDVERKIAVGTNGRKELAPFSKNKPCTIIPMSAPASIENGYSVGSGYNIYFPPGTDVKVGDKLKGLGQEFYVKAVIPYIGFGPVSHIQTMASTEIN